MPTYAIAGGADAGLFTIDSTTGLLQFVSAPDYENPGTANVDNEGRPVYEVQVTITGATAGVDTLTLAVSLLNDPETDGVIQYLAGDYTEFTPGATPDDNGPFADHDASGLAVVGDGGSASFANGALTITQLSGPTDGSFSFYLGTAGAGGDATISGGEAITTNNSLAATIASIGTVDPSADGQDGNPLVIHLNGDATAEYVGEIINALQYSAPTGGTREFYVYVNDGTGGTYGTSESVSFVMAGPTAALALTLDGTGSGTVTSTDGAVTCTQACTRAIGNGLAITLTATAESGSTFTGWAGACSGTGSCTVTLTADQAVTATFALPPLTLVDYQPSANSSNVPLTSTIVLTYSADLAAASVTSQTLAVHSMMHGLVTATYSISGNIGSITPMHPFFPGELVYTSATTQTADLNGAKPLTPTVWQFQTVAPTGDGYLTDPVSFGTGSDATRLFWRSHQLWHRQRCHQEPGLGRLRRRW